MYQFEAPQTLQVAKDSNAKAQMLHQTRQPSDGSADSFGSFSEQAG
jgi:hypothetical protein